MWPPHVLLVAPTPSVAATLSSLLHQAGCAVTLVRSFRAAKSQLERDPSVLVSEVRLGDYNGLHLAMWAQTRDIPAVVVGEADPVLEREAEHLHASYVTRDRIVDRVMGVVDSAVKSAVASASTAPLALFPAPSSIQ